MNPAGRRSLVSEEPPIFNAMVDPNEMSIRCPAEWQPPILRDGQGLKFALSLRVFVG